MLLPPHLEDYWHRYLSTRIPPAGRDIRPDDVSDFGNTPEMADDLGRLVLAGIKTATSMLAFELEQKGGRQPATGDVEIVVGGSGQPLCVIELTEVVIRSFDEIDAAFVYDYGEGERTLDWWQREMWPWYVAECQQMGCEPSPKMPLVCFRFRRVYPHREEDLNGLPDL